LREQQRAVLREGLRGCPTRLIHVKRIFVSDARGAALAGARAELHAKEGELRAAYERLAAAALERAGVRGALAAAQAELAGARAELEAWAQAGLSESRAAADDVRTAHPVAKYWVRL